MRTVLLACALSAVAACAGTPAQTSDTTSSSENATIARTTTAPHAAVATTPTPSIAPLAANTDTRYTGATGAKGSTYSGTMGSNGPVNGSTETMPASTESNYVPPVTGVKPDGTPATAPDNTKVNVRDRDATLTPINQGNSSDELRITASIRKAVMSDGSLSFMAKNVKIITVGTKVTLRGPVNSVQERSTIDARAKQTAGVTDVDDQLEVK